MAVMMYVIELVLVSSARLMSAITGLMRRLRLSGRVMNVCSCDESYQVHYSLFRSYGAGAMSRAHSPAERSAEDSRWALEDEQPVACGRRARAYNRADFRDVRYVDPAGVNCTLFLLIC